MKTDRKTRHIRDVAAEKAVIRARRPFKVSQEEKRRFIRLEISTPMSLHKIKDRDGQYWTHGDWQTIYGSILNISAGGVLVDLDQVIEEGDVVSMHFTLQGVEGLDNVLGLVKRVDIDSEGCLAGIEFISREFLVDYLSQAELELLGKEYTNFDYSIRRVLDRYVYHETTSTGV
ncbi:MAG: PilZ domain-containing protein [Candidatus Zixiibacteriota bacterium]